MIWSKNIIWFIKFSKLSKLRKGRKSEEMVNRMEFDGEDVFVIFVMFIMVVFIIFGKSRRMIIGLVKRLGLILSKNKFLLWVFFFFNCL